MYLQLYSLNVSSETVSVQQLFLHKIYCHSGTFQRLSFNLINDHKTDSDIRFSFILDFEYWIKKFVKMKLSNVTQAVQN